MKRNIAISYYLTFAKNTWFWLGIWVFYYLTFTDYSGIGLIETVLIVTITLFEIPTGAIADLFGKKKTLILAFLFETAGAFLMAYTQNFQGLLISVFVMCVGGTLFSGTLDALVYDSLKEKGEEVKYDKINSNIYSLSLLSPALCSIAGGFLYSINFRLPFILSAVGYLTGLIATFWLIEPKIDTEKFSFKNYISQTKKGFGQLFKNSSITIQTILLISIGFAVVISAEMTDSFLGVEFGFNDKQLGILWSVIFLLSAFASQLTPKIKRLFGSNKAIILIGFLMAISFLISPYIGIFVGGLSLIIRASLQAVHGNLSTVLVNRNTDSAYRATTLSTFNMIKNVPYVLLAYLIGNVSNVFSAKTTSFYMGIFLLLVLPIQGIILYRKRKR